MRGPAYNWQPVITGVLSVSGALDLAVYCGLNATVGVQISTGKQLYAATSAAGNCTSIAMDAAGNTYEARVDASNAYTFAARDNTGKQLWAKAAPNVHDIQSIVLLPPK